MRQFLTFMLCDGAAARWRCFVTFRLDNASLVYIQAFHPLHRYGDTCIQCQWQYRWIKERTPLNINFSLQNIFSCAWFPYFFCLFKSFSEFADMPSLWSRYVCKKDFDNPFRFSSLANIVPDTMVARIDFDTISFRIRVTKFLRANDKWKSSQKRVH